jgi:methionyl-tRNA formyltransferase
MNENFDLGDIVLQRRVPVADDDTVTDLFHKTVDLFAPMTLEAIDLIDSGRTDWTKQDPAEATFFHKRAEEDSRIYWTWPARDIVNLISPRLSAAAVSGGCRQGSARGTPERVVRRDWVL